MTTTPFIDFHTHHSASLEGETAIIDGRDTWGIHPWTLAEPPFPPEDSRILAIGECGIDKLCASPLPLQREAFLRCVSESRRLRKPLFLHCVRAIDECLALRRETHATEPWIWHGYRGGATQLRQLLPHGFYFSFGFNFREESLLACPLPRLLLESDADPRPVSRLYQRACLLLGVSTEALSSQMLDNYLALFAPER